SHQVVQAAGLHEKPDSSQMITLADGTQHPANLVPDCLLSISQYNDIFDLLTAPIKHDVILGKPWLEKVNPDIDWTSNTLTFRDHSQFHIWHPLETLTDEIIPDDYLILATACKEWLCDPRNKGYLCFLQTLRNLLRPLRKLCWDILITSEQFYM